LLIPDEPMASFLADRVDARGEWPGPLFVRLDRAAGPGHPSRLDAGNAARASKELGLRAGLARGTNPHGLRHQGITREGRNPFGVGRRARK
jgi:hypothetical protein